MTKTVAIYQQTEHGLLRIGIFRPHKYYSIASIAEQFRKRYPQAESDGALFMADRTLLMGMGGWVDGERIPFPAEK